MSAGVIYILTNPSFEDYVKIGYADDIEKRLQQLNRSECIPFAFRVYATYEVNSRLSDLKIHSIIDRLNPNLRAIETFNGQQRKREFYAMSPEDAYSILEAIAEIHGCAEKLRKWAPDAMQIQAEIAAQEIKKRSRSANFSFSDYKIPKGATLICRDNPDIVCTVVENRKVEYNGETMYITTFAKMISGKNYLTTGPKYLIEHFEYNGTALCELDPTTVNQ